MQMDNWPDFTTDEIKRLEQVAKEAHWREFGTIEHCRLEFARYLYKHEHITDWPVLDIMAVIG